MKRSASPRSTRWRCMASWIWSNVGISRRPMRPMTWSAYPSITEVSRCSSSRWRDLARRLHGAEDALGTLGEPLE